MALNPPISALGLPLSVQGEEFILYRDHMEIEVKIPKFQKISGKGKLYLTSCRIVFVHQKFAADQFKSFDIPIANIRKEKFEQPVFGSNYLQGDVLPLHGLIPAPGIFKLWFLQGGTQRFLKCLSRILINIQNNNYSSMNNVQTQEIRVQLSNKQSGYYDPSDPSVVYLKQPDSKYSPKSPFMGNDIYSINGESSSSFYFSSNDLNKSPAQQQRKEQPFSSGAPSYDQQSSTQYPPHPSQQSSSNQNPYQPNVQAPASTQYPPHPSQQSSSNQNPYQPNVQAPASTQYPPPPMYPSYPNQQYPNPPSPNQYYPPPPDQHQINQNPPFNPNNYPTLNNPASQNPYQQPPNFQNNQPQYSDQQNQNSGHTNQSQNQYYLSNWNQQNNKNM